jgi:glycosyltransferase involved in cell wall biosynthesis
LLPALARVRDRLEPGQVRIVGGGPERERLVAMTRALQLEDQVQWLGELTHARIAGELGQAQVFLLPSRYEGLSNAGLEALERGLPLLLTRCGGLDRYIDATTGWTAAPGDVDTLAEALAQVLSTPAQRLVEMGAQARLLAERTFDMSMIAGRYLDLFRELVAARGEADRR